MNHPPPSILTPTEEQRLEDAQRMLVRRHAYLTSHVLRLGPIVFSDDLPTAAIIANHTEVRLYFNRRFFGKISAAQLAGVLVHEALHFALKHPPRSVAIRNPRDKKLFTLACEAVINDSIRRSFPDLDLPGRPVTGQILLGCDVSGRSAEEVVRLLREKLIEYPLLAPSLLALEALDDHDAWEPDSPVQPDSADGWTEATAELADRVIAQGGANDPLWGNSPLGRDRSVSPADGVRWDLARYLQQATNPATRYESDWTQPNRKLIALYPKVVLPRCEPQHQWELLVAIDSSGSVPDPFLRIALAVARQPIARSHVRVVSFDTVVYEAGPAATALRGGGGTRVQCVEDYIRQRLPSYPDHVFVISDGHHPRPTVEHPKRWTWLLPPWGSRRTVPAGAGCEVFNLPGLRRATQS